MYPYPDEFPSRFASYSKADTDNDYVCMLKHYLKAFVRGGGSRVFLYHFKRPAPFAPAALGSFHTSELAYNFGNPCFGPTMPYGPTCTAQPTTWPAGSADAALTATVRSLWANMAAYGNPGAVWPRFGASTSWSVLALDASDATGQAVLTTETDAATADVCPYWDSRVAPHCGDNVCSSGETVFNCYVDCL
jgi:carboxylesterase type B